VAQLLLERLGHHLGEPKAAAAFSKELQAAMLRIASSPLFVTYRWAAAGRMLQPRRLPPPSQQCPRPPLPTPTPTQPQAPAARRPSLVAAAAVATLRRARGVVPAWPQALAELTGHWALREGELGACATNVEALLAGGPRPGPGLA
jgi:hypothetical protein